MDREREMAVWVSEETAEKLEKLRLSLQEKLQEKERYAEEKEKRREKRKKKSATRRWKNLRGTYEVGYNYWGVREKARFRWDLERGKDVIEMPLPSYLAIEGLNGKIQSAQQKQDWVRWQTEIDEEGEKLRIICDYRNKKFARLTDPKRRVRLVFGALGFPVIDVERVFVMI